MWVRLFRVKGIGVYVDPGLTFDVGEGVKIEMDPDYPLEAKDAEEGK